MVYERIPPRDGGPITPQAMRIEIDDKSGFCFGVVRAIGEAERALAAGGTVC